MPIEPSRLLLKLSGWRRLLPSSLKHRLVTVLSERFGITRLKYAAELDFWRTQYEAQGGNLVNQHYEPFFLAMAEEPDASFCRDKVVADFGCGPRGSLCWATEARERIGIDVLADAYRDLGIEKHDMRYVQSSERHIPLPDASVDILFTLNAVDHVHHLADICREMLRILKPGGELIGSFNLDEPPVITEPLCLTAEQLDRHLFDPLELRSYRLVPQGPDSIYQYFDEPPPDEPPPGPRVLWARARKPG